MTTVGRARDFRMRVEEPDPRRVLTESDERSSMPARCRRAEPQRQQTEHPE